MKKSAFTQEPIEPDKEVQVVVAFPDGRRRKLHIRADEEEALRHSGEPLSDSSVVVGFLRRNSTRALWAITLLLLGSLVVPAFTKQWSDRTYALEVKQAAVGHLWRFAELPVYQAMSRFDPKAPPTRTVIPPALETFNATQAPVVVDLGLYLNDADLEDALSDWRRAVYWYVTVGCHCTDQFAYSRPSRTDIKHLLAYGPADARSEPRTSDPEHEAEIVEAVDLVSDAQMCFDRAAACVAAYRFIGDEITSNIANYAERYARAHVTGTSSGWKDFIRDIWPL